MFKEKIQQTPLTTPEGLLVTNSMLDTTRYECEVGDATLISTLTALLYKRFPEGDERLSIYDNNIRMDSVPDYREILRWVRRSVNGMNDEPNTFYIVSINGDKEIVHDTLSNLISWGNSGSVPMLDGWEYVSAIQALFKSNFDIACFVNKFARSVFLFVGRCNTQRFHAMQCALPAMFPWLFNAEAPLSEFQRDLMYSLRNDTPNDYLRLIQSFVDTLGDVYHEYIHRAIGNIVRGSYEQQISQSESVIAEYTRRISRYFDEIADLRRQVGDAQVHLWGLQYALDKGGAHDDELEKYLVGHDNIAVFDVCNTQMTLVIKDYLSVFDSGDAARVIDNEDSYVYRYVNNHSGSHVANKWSADDLRLISQALFVDKTIKIRACAAYKLTIGEAIRPISGFGYGMAYNSYMPNPHIDRWSCAGEYLPTMAQYVQEGDIPMALEYALASCRSLNFGDYTVMNTFYEVLTCHGDHKPISCFELPDGSVVDQYAAIEWLINKEREAMIDDVPCDEIDE